MWKTTWFIRPSHRLLHSPLLTRRNWISPKPRQLLPSSGASHNHKFKKVNHIQFDPDFSAGFSPRTKSVMVQEAGPLTLTFHSLKKFLRWGSSRFQREEELTWHTHTAPVGYMRTGKWNPDCCQHNMRKPLSLCFLLVFKLPSICSLLPLTDASLSLWEETLPDAQPPHSSKHSSDIYIYICSFYYYFFFITL